MNIFVTLSRICSTHLGVSESVMSFLDKFKKSENVVESTKDHQVADGEVDHLWMKEDLDAKKPKLEHNPKIDTGILRNQIAEKIAKMNNN